MTNLFSVLGREQSVGESSGRILHQQGVSDPGVYAQGILRYAQAKAAFDGVIEEAKAHLAEDIDLAEVPGFSAQLQGAVNQRTAFTDYVAEKLIGDTRGERLALRDLLEPAELLKELIGGLRALWQEYRSAQDERRETLRQQLDALRWRPFHELMGD